MPADLEDNALPIFRIDKVTLQFSISADFAAAQVANNVLILALTTGRILRIDLDSPSDIDDVDLPKKAAEIGVIRKLFLDPSASHLIIATTLGENYYLHAQSRQPKALSRLKGVGIESIAWNPSLPTASTREILVGAVDGNVYEDYIEPSSEFYRSQEKYLKLVYKAPEGPAAGLQVEHIPGISELRRILLATPTKLLHFVGKVGRLGSEGSGSLYTKLCESEAPTLYEVASGNRQLPASLALSPDAQQQDDGAGDENEERHFAWLSAQGILHGKLRTSTGSGDLGSAVFNNSKLIERTSIPASEGPGGRKRPLREPIAEIVLSQWHILCLVEGRVVALRRLDEQVVYDQVVLEPGQTAIGIFADQKKNTFWLFTTREIYEIVATDEDRDVWKIMLMKQEFGLASRYARSPAQKDAVATASGDHLVSRGQYSEAARIYGQSSRPFEQVALTFIDHGEHDALRRYLLTKIATYKKSSVMQRTMIASWLVEIFMSKLNSLDDNITTKAQLTESTSTAETENELDATQKAFNDFLTSYESDLDKQTTYEIISNHGREQELLSYATAIDDHNYVLSYWVQRERWQESLDVLKRQQQPDMFYKYSSVLMEHAPTEFVDILTRHDELDPVKLIPAILNYNNKSSTSLSQNQAVRYLNFCVNSLHMSSPAIHNTLLSIYASHPSPSENPLLSYLSTHSLSTPPPYDVDFAFRLCIQHDRVQSAVHIYSSMGDYTSAVNLALKHDEIDLASLVADRPSDGNPALRKRLWLEVAKKVISQQGTGSIKTAIDFLKRCDLLRIEDLIPFFPDFVVIDDFKEEICAALESYSRSIAALDAEMDASAATAEHIKADIKQLDRRYALVEPGERCRVCELPLLSRQFFVFPSCQHSFHSDCLGRKVVDGSGVVAQRRIRELQASISEGGRKEREGRELDALIGAQCILCGDLAIKSVDQPFITDSDDDADDWSI